MGDTGSIKGSTRGSVKQGSLKSTAGSTKKGGSRKGGSRKNSVAMGSTLDMLQPIMEDDQTYSLYVNLQAFACTGDAYRQLHPKAACFMVQKQTDAYPNMSVPKPRGFAAVAAPAVIKQAMMSLLKEVVLDMDIKSSFSSVDDKPTPYFCQFSSAPPSAATLRAAVALEKVKMREENGDPTPRESPDPDPLPADDTQAEEGSGQALTPAENAAEDAADEGIRPESAGSVTSPTSALFKKGASSSAMAKVTSEAMAVAKAKSILARNEKLAKEKMEADALRKLHRDEDFYYLMSKIMENTMANLAVEASYGEFETTKVPRQIVEVRAGEGQDAGPGLHTGEDLNHNAFTDTFVQDKK